MIKQYRFSDLGQVNRDWLQARHHFSFAEYYNPDRVEFGALQVINDDLLTAGCGFKPHMHRNVEIVTYVRKGAITHEDSQGNESRLVAGSVQLITAGSGIMHSEHNSETVDTSIFQIWIEPNQSDLEPHWQSETFSQEPVTDSLNLLVSGNGEAPITINQDAYIYAGKLSQGTKIVHAIHDQAYILVSNGGFQINQERLYKGDGAEVTDEAFIEITAITDAEILVIDVPSNPEQIVLPTLE